MSKTKNPMRLPIVANGVMAVVNAVNYFATGSVLSLGFAVVSTAICAYSYWYGRRSLKRNAKQQAEIAEIKASLMAQLRVPVDDE
ncbi:hypothetical protein GS982_01820 [Rhodococcus hoagii]|uniref:Holin n=1 Tax=Rhodococcus hoagii TaxID=43767 RepID=A0A9Q4ZIS9_RHOHA|nr:hypothetical protein [Prescottella equi]NKT77338.1 hypothetical protein [Prescottella equi]NKZ81123.1 hypothetical protein [Prescottella equi]